MSTKKNYRFETLQLHVGQEQADPATDARAVPIYQTTSYVFHNSQHAADRFGLRDAGNIYGRLTNSTQGVFEDRVAALEGGVAGLAVASGAAAITYALQNIVQAGDHIVAADNLYGGSYNLITHTLATQGIGNTIVNVNDLEALEAAITLWYTLPPSSSAVTVQALAVSSSMVESSIGRLILISSQHWPSPIPRIMVSCLPMLWVLQLTSPASVPSCCAIQVPRCRLSMPLSSCRVSRHSRCA